MLAQDGLAPAHCTTEGEPLYSLESLADALGADVDDLVALAEELEAVGLDVRREAAGRLH